MALTDNSDIYVSLHEDGINRLVDHLMRKRPSLFHYGTARMVAAAHAASDAAGYTPRKTLTHLPRGMTVPPSRVRPCVTIGHTSEVTDPRWDNPLMTEQDPVPVLGTGGLVGLDYCVQITEMELDFAPDDLEYGIESQQFAAHLELCAGLACPGEDGYDAVLAELDGVYAYLEAREMTVADLTADEGLMAELGLPIVPLPEATHCFCLEVSVVGSVELIDRPSAPEPVSIPQSPRFAVHDIRVDDVHGGEFAIPKGMRAGIECYLHSFIQLGLLPTLSRAVGSISVETLRMQRAVFDVDLTSVTAEITLPESAAVPNNPAIEDDEFRTWVDIDVRSGGGA